MFHNTCFQSEWPEEVWWRTTHPIIKKEMFTLTYRHRNTSGVWIIRLIAYWSSFFSAENHILYIVSIFFKSHELKYCLCPETNCRHVLVPPWVSPPLIPDRPFRSALVTLRTAPLRWTESNWCYNWWDVCGPPTPSSNTSDVMCSLPFWIKP